MGLIPSAVKIGVSGGTHPQSSKWNISEKDLKLSTCLTAQL